MFTNGRFRLLSVAIIVGLSILSACNCHETVQGTLPASAVQPRDDIKGLSNFAKVSETLYRGAQPDKEGFAELKKLGIKTIINLRANHSDIEMMKGLGLQYCFIPSDSGDIKEENVAAFLKVVTNPAHQPVFVHCAHGADRTGTMIAVYRICFQNWSRQDALNETDVFGRHTIYPNIPRYIMGFDIEAIKKKAETAPEPKMETIN
ncbi:MAG: dual specificity protein phosphatase family protein [Planctomycetes bacterium]|nr:dual specificity protein phosphatase family protein [Planctomycetota bacterium]